jgi:cyclic pyranopterin phosphate synthase
MNVKPIKTLIDSYGRRIRKLRVSLLDACNFRCVYCMPLNPVFMDSSRWLRPEEIERVCATLVDFGLEQIRLTGGEPTLRDDFRDIVLRLSSLPLDKLGLTTNGWNLTKELDFLSDTNCRHINISLDSLTKEIFNRITRRNYFDKVLDSILSAKRLGFHVKINTVLMRGINDHEIFDFINFSAVHGVEIRFLELMSIGQVSGSKDKLFVPASEVIQMISSREELTGEQSECDSTSFNFKTSSGASIGFIASETLPFCRNCSRWRLSADGFLRACLMSEKGIYIRDADPEDYKFKLNELLMMKPYRKIERIEQDMYKIGG